MGHNTLRPIRKSLLLYETEAGPHKVRAEHDATPVTPQKGIWRIYVRRTEGDAGGRTGADMHR
jgi:hypothetical protein